MRLVVASECGTGRNTDNTVKLDVIFHEYIQYSCGEETSHTASLKY